MLSGRRVRLLAGHDAASGTTGTAHLQRSGLDSPTCITESAAAGVGQDPFWAKQQAKLLTGAGR